MRAAALRVLVGVGEEVEEVEGVLVVPAAASWVIVRVGEEVEGVVREEVERVVVVPVEVTVALGDPVLLNAQETESNHIF